ncbi:BrnA antitoxin family protein [Thiocapsa sp.]|uniref:BrnA antitoxin family protein n=1 Tax=Thiocapsa sp. TaxID=2024551 RepID=UPI0035948D83
MGAATPKPPRLQPAPLGHAGAGKVYSTIRFDADLPEALKARGPGWQTSVNDALRTLFMKPQEPNPHRSPGVPLAGIGAVRAALGARLAASRRWPRGTTPKLAPGGPN